MSIVIVMGGPLNKSSAHKSHKCHSWMLLNSSWCYHRHSNEKQVFKTVKNVRRKAPKKIWSERRKPPKIFDLRGKNLQKCLIWEEKTSKNVWSERRTPNNQLLQPISHDPLIDFPLHRSIRCVALTDSYRPKGFFLLEIGFTKHLFCNVTFTLKFQKKSERKSTNS